MVNLHSLFYVVVVASTGELFIDIKGSELAVTKRSYRSVKMKAVSSTACDLTWIHQSVSQCFPSYSVVYQLLS